MEVFSTLVGILVAAAAGFYFGRNFSGSALEKTRLEAELKEKKAELDAFRNKVTGHFEKTADLFNQVSDSYQSLYDHMASSSSQLCSTPTFQTLPPQQAESNIEAKPNPAHKTNNDESNLFDADNLYNAHDYRNQAQDPDASLGKEEIINNGKIVDFESAKEENKEPALDYAIKKDGVINHNSLGIDGIKGS